eukprot:SAG22_NODE_10301_length_542_cov_1.056433_1_plen_44_part_01
MLTRKTKDARDGWRPDPLPVRQADLEPGGGRVRQKGQEVAVGVR